MSAECLRRLCVPISYRGSRIGFLWLIDDDARLGEAQVRTAVRAAEQAGLLMFDDQLAARLASGALAHLLAPSARLRADAVRQMTESGLLSPPGPVVAIVVQAVISERRAARRATPPLQPLLADSMRKVTRRLPAGSMIGLAHADHGILVARVGESDDTAELELAAVARRSLLLQLRRDYPCADVTAGIGDTVNALADAHLAYRQARLAARVAATVRATGPVARWRDLGAFRVLAQLPSDGDAAASIDPRLVQLLSLADGPVVTTLETYLDLAGEVKTTAERLHLHRETLYYRLRKAQQLAGIDLRDGHDRLAIHLGFKLARLTGVYPDRASK